MATTRKPVRKCDECGHRKADVTKVADPFVADVNNEVWMRWLCGDCYWMLAEEI